MDVNRRILMAVAEVDVWLLAARRVGVIVALLVGAAAVLCGMAWIAGRWKARCGGDGDARCGGDLFRPACGGPPSPEGKAGKRGNEGEGLKSEKDGEVKRR